jgi:uncharacterized membrane protein
MSLCKYKNVLGVPGKGIHSYRVFGVAIADVVMTIVGAFLISYFFKFSFVKTLLVLFLSGIVLHRLFCVRTTIDKLLFSRAPFHL